MQTLSQSVNRVFGRAEVGGRFLAASRQYCELQQCDFIHAMDLEPASAPCAHWIGSSRFGVLPAVVVGAAGSAASALHRGGQVTRTGSQSAAQKSSLDGDRSRGHGGQRVLVSRPRLAAGQATGFGSASGVAEQTQRRQESAGCAWLSISGTGDQSGLGGQAVGRVAPI